MIFLITEPANRKLKPEFKGKKIKNTANRNMEACVTQIIPLSIWMRDLNATQKYFSVRTSNPRYLLDLSITLLLSF
jgi:hypothetical protein